MPVRISFFRRLLDFFFPRYCAICGRELAVSDHAICTVCNWHLPRTRFHETPRDNEMARRFWVLIPVEKAAALYYYYAHSKSTRVILQFKYNGRWNYAEDMGRIAANEFLDSGFFDGVDAIVPVPVTRKRKMQRGYNQSYHIALGVSELTGLPVITDAVERISFSGSQTRKSAMERRENVKHVFRLRNSSRIRGRHVLIVDDVVTTGSTIISCAEELQKGGARTFSVMSIGYTKH